MFNCFLLDDESINIKDVVLIKTHLQKQDLTEKQIKLSLDYLFYVYFSFVNCSLFEKEGFQTKHLSLSGSCHRHTIYRSVCHLE